MAIILRQLALQCSKQGRRFGPTICYRTLNVGQARLSQEGKSESGGHHQSESEENYENNIKNKILEASLQFVIKDGWSVKALSQGAESVDYPGVAHGLFPNGGADLINYFNLKCNTQLAEIMQEWSQKSEEKTKNPIDFIRDSITARLEMLDPYRDTWATALAIQSLPSNVPAALATILALADDICYHGGDRSVDVNWYIRRIGVAGIYKASELYLLTDNSEGRKSTKKFIAARLQDAQMLHGALGFSSGASQAPQALQAAFVTARNMLGLNWNR